MLQVACDDLSMGKIKFPPEGSTETLIFTIDSVVASGSIEKVSATTVVDRAISLLRQQEIKLAEFYMTPNSPEIARIRKFLKQTTKQFPGVSVIGQQAPFNWDDYVMSMRGDTVLLQPNDAIMPHPDSLVLSADIPKTYELLLINGKYLRYNQPLIIENRINYR